MIGRERERETPARTHYLPSRVSSSLICQKHSTHVGTGEESHGSLLSLILLFVVDHREKERFVFSFASFRGRSITQTRCSTVHFMEEEKRTFVLLQKSISLERDDLMHGEIISDQDTLNFIFPATIRIDESKSDVPDNRPDRAIDGPMDSTDVRVRHSTASNSPAETQERTWCNGREKTRFTSH